ncbi:hypothetical protein R1sor_005882 [Riccia sorocarpa]|uniref:Uncharacterized protein n=1 Tax=Riccia sorocarpa TaxID=122646 RepID=A0ABD3HQ19_9MARC
MLNGDIRTTSVKRKSAYNARILKNDTHRHNKPPINRNSGVIRGEDTAHAAPLPAGVAANPHHPPPASETINCETEFNTVVEDHVDVHPDSAPLPAGVAATSHQPRPAREIGNWEMDYYNVVEDHVSVLPDPTPLPAGVAASSHQPRPARETVNCETDYYNVEEDHMDVLPGPAPLPAGVAANSFQPRQARVAINNEADDVDVLPGPATVAQPTASVVSLSSDSVSLAVDDDSDVEIIDTTPRRRPPTRSQTRRFVVRDEAFRGPTQYGLPIVEVDVDVRQWHICRTSTNGSGPACFAATPCRSAPRALCKTKIRVAGYSRLGVGLVAPSFVGKSTYMTVQRDYRYWFCPNGKCHRGHGASQCKTQMPLVPMCLPVRKGTGLTQDKVDFLTSSGIDLVQRRMELPRSHTSSFPSESEIKILVNAYPEKNYMTSRELTDSDHRADGDVDRSLLHL